MLLAAAGAAGSAFLTTYDEPDKGEQQTDAPFVYLLGKKEKKNFMFCEYFPDNANIMDISERQAMNKKTLCTPSNSLQSFYSCIYLQRRREGGGGRGRGRGRGGEGKERFKDSWSNLILAIFCSLFSRICQWQDNIIHDMGQVLDHGII